MCGIVGVVDPSLRVDAARAIVAEMCATIVHRGPDDIGLHAEDGLAVGMRRLAIVDIAHGRQPMSSDDGKIVLVFNGEIYNAPALRRELQREGVRFDTRSDTEVILRLYEKNPDSVEERLAGMWGFAIVDQRRKRVVLSRDRFGIKPLFVLARGERLAFASELRAFEPLRGAAAFAPAFEIDPASAHAMVAWSYVPGEATILRGVRRLAPGSRLEWSLEGHAPRTSIYYRVSPSSEAARVKSMDEAIELVEPALRRAVTEHLESDVDVASFLSGGIDSSLVTRYAQEARQTPVHAFTIAFAERRFDESPAAREVARLLGAEHHVEQLDVGALRPLLADAMLAYDEPFGDSSSLATYTLSRLVARTHKVALAGDGGDEVFSGYRKHQIIGARAALSRIPGARPAAAAVLAALPARVDRSRPWTEAVRVLRRLGRGLEGSDAAAYVALTQVASMGEVAPLFVEPASAASFIEPLSDYFVRAGSDPLRRTLAADLANPLPNDMLTKVDRASMALSLEVRVPMLDHRLAEIGLGLPARFTLGFGEGKQVLRVMHERRFGRALARRPKQGFGVPVEAWMRGDLAPVFDEVFQAKRLSSHGLLSAEALGHGRWRRWAERMPQVLWHAFALAVWCESFSGRGGRIRDLLGGRPVTVVAEEALRS